jgi:hypothetical protein
VCAKTATRDTDAADGRAVSGGAGEPGARVVSLLGEVVAAVKALTIDPTPYVMPSPDRAEPMRPLGVVPRPDPVTSSISSSSDSCKGSSGVA